MKNESSFLNTLLALRKREQITIFTKLQKIEAWEEQEVLAFLKSEFEMERLDWMDATLPFDAEAALWAAKTIYFSAQLLLVREGTGKDLAKLFPEIKANNSVSAHLSADLTLRFLPPIIVQLKITDEQDMLLPILENALQLFHYSAIGYPFEITVDDWPQTLANSTFKKLYLERVVAQQDYCRAEIPFINQQLLASFGLYKNKIWSTLKTINQEE